MKESLSINDCQDVLSSVECCNYSLEMAEANLRAWKWVLLSIHSALQGSMVCLLKMHHRHEPLDKKSKKLNIEWENEYVAKLENGKVDNGEKMMELLLQVPDKKIDFAEQLFSKVSALIKFTENQVHSFSCIHYWRNELIHFKPDRVLSIDVGHIKRMVKDGIDIITIIMECRSNPLEFMEEDEVTILRLKLSEIRKKLKV